MTGALLAGGASSRMGRDKCLIEIDGTPLWKRQTDLLAAVCDEVLVIAPDCPAWCSHRWLPDAAKNRGPLAGLCAALEKASSPFVLALAVDLPAISADYLRSLTTLNTGVVPELDGFFEPLSAIYPKSALPMALRHLEQPDHSLQTLIRGLIGVDLVRPMPVQEIERPLFRNLNTPGD